MTQTITRRALFQAQSRAQEISNKLLLAAYSQNAIDQNIGLADAYERLSEVAALLGFKIERIVPVSAAAEQIEVA